MPTVRVLDRPVAGDSLLAVLRLYRGVLGRDPAGAGLRPLLDAYAAGRSLAELAHGLLASPEGRARHGGPDGLADAAFARAVIESAAGGPDAAALALAPGLVGVARATALALLAETPLFRADPPALPALFGDRRPDDPAAYAYWCRHFEADDASVAPSRQCFTLAMAVGDTGAEAARRSVLSLQAQSHAAWRLVLRAELRSPWCVEVVERLAEDGRVTLWHVPAPPLHALLRQHAEGEGLVCVLAAGDVLAVHALAHFARAFDDDPGTCLAYCDEDRLDEVMGRVAPRFKTAPSLDMLLAGDAVGRLAMYRASLLAALGDPDPASPHPAHDLALLACRRDAGALRHLPRVLLHADPSGRADWPVPADHPRPAGLPAVRAASGSWPRVVPPAADGTLVSVIVATRDRADLLAAVTEGVLAGTAHAPLELILVDHDSTEPRARALLDRLARDGRVRVLTWSGAFNFAAMNNRAAEVARGEVLVLLNNDIEVIRPDWLTELAGHALRPEIGLVGARLLHRDGRLQHGGIVLGPGGRATHLFRGAALDDPGYLGLLAVTRDVAAVTGACMAIRRTVYQAVGGMNEALPVAWNDIDLCQRVRAAGLRVLWTPHAVLTHLEGETRGRDDHDAARQAAFLADGARYRALWGEAADIDPWLNSNLVATDTELCLAPPRLGPSP